MKPFRNLATGYLPTALATAAFLLAAQPARASTYLHSTTPPGAAQSIEVHLQDAGPDTVMIGGFSLDLRPIDRATASTLGTGIFSGVPVGALDAPSGIGAVLADVDAGDVAATPVATDKRESSDGLGPMALLPTALVMICMGVFRRRRLHVGRRAIPGVRKPAISKERAPCQANADTPRYAV